jgi:uncharacterized protein YbjQ (UPF0145 family)
LLALRAVTVGGAPAGEASAEVRLMQRCSVTSPTPPAPASGEGQPGATPSGLTSDQIEEMSADELDQRSLAAVQAGQLPLRAQQRVATLRRGASWTSDLAVAEFGVIGTVGFRPVGQVLGTSVYLVSYSGTTWCGGGGSFQRAGGAGGRKVWVSAVTSAKSEPLIRALYDVRRRALDRMTAEAVALGGDGVVGVALTMRRFPDTPDAVEFEAIGTAVRADGEVRPSAPFLSDLSGQDFVKLLRSGWVPVGIAMGVDITVRHDGRNTRDQSRSWFNTEIDGHTQLVQETRDGCRSALEADVQRLHGEGVVVRDMTLQIREQACSTVQGTLDHFAEATILGTAIVQYTASPHHAGPPTLPILRLGGRRSPDTLIASRGL